MGKPGGRFIGGGILPSDDRRLPSRQTGRREPGQVAQRRHDFNGQSRLGICQRIRHDPPQGVLQGSPQGLRLGGREVAQPLVAPHQHAGQQLHRPPLVVVQVGEQPPGGRPLGPCLLDPAERRAGRLLV